MKNLKSLIALFAVISFVGSSALFAQQTGNVAVTALVQDALVLTPTDIALGTIQSGAVSTIGANAGQSGSDANLGTTIQRGSLAIAGNNSASIEVSWANATLTDDAGTPNTLTFTPSVYNGASSVTSGATLALDGSGDLTLGVGGTLDAPSVGGSYTTGTAGANSGTPIVFTVSYN